MNSKFNSLFDNENKIDLKLNNYYNINNNDNINLDPRIRNNTLILNYSDKEIENQKLLNDRRYGSLPVTIIQGRPCSTSLCTSNKFCDSSGKPEILYDAPLTCNNDFVPQGIRGDNKKYINNIDIESRLLNIDYKVKNKSCGTKDFKEPKLKSLKCFKDDALLGDSISFNKKSFKQEPKNNNHCNKSYNEPLFNYSSKRIDTISW